MPNFTHTYDLVKLKKSVFKKENTHPLARDVLHTQRLYKEIKAAKESSQKLAALAARYQAIDEVRAPDLAKQKELNFLKEAFQYAKGSKTLGKQFASDIQRGYKIEGQKVQEGDKESATRVASEFMAGLTEPQKLLANQSQGLAAPTNDFLSQSLNFGDNKKISAANFAVTSVAFSNVNGKFSMVRQDKFYSFNNAPIDGDLSLSKLYYKEVGKEGVQSAINLESDLYQQMKKAIENPIPLNKSDSNGFISFSYKNEANELVNMKIEPILSAQNTITMEGDFDSLDWKTKVTTHTEGFKLDKIFESEKEAITSRNIFARQTANEEARQKPIETKFALPGPSSTWSRLQAWVSRRIAGVSGTKQVVMPDSDIPLVKEGRPPPVIGDPRQSVPEPSNAQPILPQLDATRNFTKVLNSSTSVEGGNQNNTPPKKGFFERFRKQ